MNNNLRKIIYVTHARLPTEKAHGRAVVKLCEAFVKEGIDVELVIPRLWAQKEIDILSWYHVSSAFEIKKISCIDFGFIKVFERLTYPLRFFSFSKAALWYLWRKYRNNKEGVLFFSHDTIPLYFLSFFFKNIFYDVHDFPPNNFMGRRVMKKAIGFSSQTFNKKAALETRFGTSPKKIVYWPNGTEIEKFDIPFSKEEARKKLALPTKEKIAVYAGQLFDWKGVDTLIQSSSFLGGKADSVRSKDMLHASAASNGVKIYIVGGGNKDIEKVKKNIPEARNNNVVFIGNRPHEEIPLWLRAADAVILPNTAKKEISRLWTSPMKLFEYMASGTPIVSSCIPSIEEIVTEEDVFFAEADNPQSFADVMKEAMGDTERAQMRAAHALQEVRRYTWQARAKKIIEHIAEVEF